MLTPGPNGPGDAIDTYLQPLIEELKELWEVGIETCDASTRTNFKLYVSLLWTIKTFQHIEIYLDGVKKEKWHAHVAIKTLPQFD